MTELTEGQIIERLREGKTRPKKLFLAERAVLEARNARPGGNGLFLRATRKYFEKNPYEKIQSVQDSIGAYNSSRSRIDNLDFGLSIGNQMVENALGSIGGATGGRGGVIGGILVNGLASAAVVYLEKRQEQFIGGLNENARGKLVSRISRHMNAQGLTLDQYDPKDVETVKSELRLEEFYEVTDALPELDTEARTELMEPLFDKLANQIVAGNLVSVLGDIKLEDDLDEMERKLLQSDKKIWKAIRSDRMNTRQLADNLTTAMEGVLTRVGANSAAIGELQSDVKANSSKISSLATILSGQASPEEKLKMIDAGLLEVPQGQREEVRQELKSQIKDKKLVDTTAQTLQEAGALAQILDDVGADGEPISKVVAFGNAAFSAYMNFQSGNVLSGFASITGIMGGASSAPPSPNPEIMAAFEKVFEKLEQMDQKLNDLLSGQEKILDQLDRLEQKIDNGFVEINETFSDVIKLIESDFEENLTFLEGRADDEGIEAQRGRLPNYTQMKKLKNLYVPESWHIFKRLETSQEGGFNQVFSARKIELTAQVTTGGLSGSYEAVCHLAKRLIARDPILDWDLFEQSLLLPTDRISAIKVKSDESHKLDLKLHPQVDFFPLSIDTLLDPRMVVRVVRQAANYNTMMALFLDNRLLTEEEILGGKYNEAARDWLDMGLRMVITSISQQTLLSGDILLPRIYDLFEGTIQVPDQDDPDREIKRDVIDLLCDQNLDALRRNVAMYFLRERVWSRYENGGFKVQNAYKNALEQPAQLFRELHLFTGTTGDGLSMDGPTWNFTSSAQGPCLAVGSELRLPLPPPERLSDASGWQLYFPTSLTVLSELRSSIWELRETYELGEQMQPDAYELLLLS